MLCEDGRQATDTVGGDRYPVNLRPTWRRRAFDCCWSPARRRSWSASMPDTPPNSSGSYPHDMTVAVVNQRGANDDLVFNGESFVVDGDGRMLHARGEFVGAAEGIDVVDLETAEAHGHHGT